MKTNVYRDISIWILLTLLIGTLPAMASTESYNFTFNRSDFKVETKDSITSVEPLTGDYMTTHTPGSVSLPFKPVRIVIPCGSKEASFTFSNTTELVASDVYMPPNGLPMITGMSPKPGLTLPSGGEPIAGEAIVNQDDIAVRLLSTNAIQNGVVFSEYAIKPFVYDSDNRKLYFVSSVTLNINYDIDNYVSELPILAERFSADRVTNLKTLETYIQAEAKTRAGIADAVEFDYAIITSEALAPAFDEMVRWKNMKGVRTRVFTMEDIKKEYNKYDSDADNLKDFLRQLYSDHHIQYLLLGGDSNIVPAKMCRMDFSNLKNAGIDTFPVDLYFACFDGDLLWDSFGGLIPETYNYKTDLTPEIYVGRLPLNDPLKIANYCKKCVKYETEMFNESYYNTYLFAGEVVDYKYDLGSDTYYSAMSKINGCMSNHCDTSKKNIFKLFNYYGWEKEDALYYDKATFQNVISNNEILLMNLDCHGNSISWNIFERKDSFKTIALWPYDFKTNKKPSFIITEACKTNKFTDSTCLSKSLIALETGCYTYIGSTTYGFFSDKRKSSLSASSFVTACLLDNLFNPDTNFYYNVVGPQLYNAKKDALKEISSDKCIRALMYSISLMGDPNLIFYTKTPTQLKGVIKDNNNVLNISVPNAPDTYWITLTQGNNIQKYVVGNQGEKDINISYGMEPYTIVAYANDSLPWVYESTNFDVLYLHDIEITRDVKYTARKTIIGENVKIVDGVRLEIVSSEGFEIRNNVICGDQATFKFVYN